MKTMESIRLLAALLAPLVALVSVQAHADGPPGYGPQRVQMESEYARAALDAYGRGYALIESGNRLDQDAAAARDDRTRQGARMQSVDKYQEALQAFGEAIRLEPRMYEAHTYIGYANRKLGRYDLALAAYEQALQIKPDYAEAIEYQGEAYLGLGRFERAKFNYLRLYAVHPVQAQKLLDAMQRWMDEQQRKTGGLSRKELAAARAWIADRRQASHLAGGDPGAW